MKRIKLLTETISTVALYSPHAVEALEALFNSDISTNVLCIYGHSGTGKTYLLKLATDTLINYGYSPDDIVKISAYDWISNMVDALKNDCIEEFEKQYDLKKYVFIEDIQHYFHKDRSQEEFLRFVERAIKLDIKIIVTSSFHPLKDNEMGVNEHLMSRLCSGIITRLIEPTENAKKHFTSSYSKYISLDLDEESIDYISFKVKNNYFELIGILNSLKTYQSKNSNETLSTYIYNSVH